MKVAITADPFIPIPPTNYGGIERIIHFLVEGLSDKGHEVALVAHRHSKVSVQLFEYPFLGNTNLSHFANIRTVSKLKSWKPDIIHSFSRLAYLIPFFAMELPKLMSYQREPTISQIQKAIFFSKKGTLSFTGCSNYISEKIKPYANAYTVYNGIDLNIYKFQKKVNHDAPLIFLGRIEPIKGTHIAINAALKTNTPLVIAGNVAEEHKGYFEEQVRPYLSETVKYIGPVNDFQKNELLGMASALLMPIEWNEPFGIVMVEAFSCGTPVIGYGRGAVPEVVQHGMNGFLASDFQSLCDCILQRAMISRETVRKSAETMFSSKIIVDKYINVYKSLLRQ